MNDYEAFNKFYFDAVHEAFNKFFYGDNKQEAKSDSGKPQLWHLACNIAFLCELEEMP